MTSASPVRRPLGLLAVGALTASTAVLGFGGVAHAAPSGWVFSSDDPSPITVPAGTCAIAWTITGGPGGVGDSGTTAPQAAQLRQVTTEVTVGDEFTLGAGGAGADFADAGAAGTNPEGNGAFDGQAGIAADGGGGGGAASVVLTADGEVYLSARGGKGGGASYAPGGFVGDSGTAVIVSDTGLDLPAVDGSPGRITGEGIACTASTPEVLGITPSDGTLVVDFTNGDDGNALATGYEWTKDDGKTWSEFDGTVNAQGNVSGTIEGLINGTSYTIKVRAVAGPDAAPSAASEAVTATPVATAAPDAPGTETDADVVVGQATNLVVTTTPTAITATWDAPTTKGDHDVAGYEVGWGLENMGNTECLVAATEARTCTFTAEPGLKYTVSVFTVDTEGNTSDPARVVVTAGVPIALPMPATVPDSNGTIERPAGETGSVAVGEKVTLRGTGYKPNSAVTVAIYSDPQVLTTVFADENGSFEVTVTVPEGLAAGEHTLVASGVDKDGNVRNLTLPVTVAANGEAALASTGADIALPLAGGAAALLLGGGLLVASRRRANA